MTERGYVGLQRAYNMEEQTVSAFCGCPVCKSRLCLPLTGVQCAGAHFVCLRLLYGYTMQDDDLFLAGDPRLQFFD